jgi:hypothetical protein
MGTIKCDYCGKQIQDNIRKCPFCNGSVITESTIKNEVYAAEERAKTKNSKIIIIITLIVIALVAVIISIVTVVKANTLTSDEEHIYKIISKYKDYLKDPDSMQLRGKAVYIMDKEYNTYTFFTASANNSFGAKVTSIPMFMGYTYIGDFYDKEPDKDASTEEKLVFLNSKLALTSWQIYGDDLSKQDDYIYSVSVECNKIAHKLHCEYVEN